MIRFRFFGRFPGCFLGALLLSVLASPVLAQTGPQLDKIKLPDGFKISILAQVPEARSLAVVPELNAVFVGTRAGGKVSIVADANRDGKADQVSAVMTGLKAPNGVAWKDGYLYVAEQNSIVRIAVPNLAALATAKPEIVLEGLPDKGHHGWRYIGFDPQGRLVVTIGSPCNICAPSGLEGTIARVENGKPFLHEADSAIVALVTDARTAASLPVFALDDIAAIADMMLAKAVTVADLIAADSAGA